MSSPSTNSPSGHARLGTPARAILTNLTSRSSPSIPPASQMYEPLITPILRHKLLRHVFVATIFLSWTQATIWTLWSKGGYSHVGFLRFLALPYLPGTVVSAALGWLVGALPIIILRKRYVSSQPLIAPSPSSLVKAAFSRPTTSRALAVYATSAILTLTLHILSAYLHETSSGGDPRLTIFVKSKKHPFYLNGRLVFLLLSQLTVASSFLIREIMLDRFSLRWKSSQGPRGPWWSFTLASLFAVLVVVTLLTTLTLPIACLAFATLRMALPIIYRVPFLPLILRPFSAHFVRGPYTATLLLKHTPLIIRAWLLAFTTIFTWETSELVFSASITRPVSVAHVAPDLNLALLSGISSEHQAFKYFAYSELRRVAKSEAPFAVSLREALFGDQKYTPKMWSHLVRESLLLLGKDYQRLLRRGELPPPPLAPVPPKAPITLPEPPATPIPLLRKSIYRSTRDSPIQNQNVVDSLASDGSLTKALEAGADAANIPEIFRSIESAVVPTPAKKEVEQTVQAAKAWPQRMKANVVERTSTLLTKYLPQGVLAGYQNVHAWWKNDRPSKMAEVCLPNRDLDVIVVDVLSSLTCASLTEDQYGVVQKDIPKILEAMLSFLSAIEEYQVIVNALYTPPQPEEKLSEEALKSREAVRLEVERAGEILGVLRDGLTDGVARIVRRFGDKLLAFKFPSRTAHHLQKFLDYC